MGSFFTLLYIIFTTVFLMTTCLTQENTRRDILASLLNESTYDSKIPPNFEKNVPTTVKVQLSVSNMYSLSETAMEYSIDCILRQLWMDDRLNYEKWNVTSEKLEVDDRSVDRVWEPDLFFVNEKHAALHSVTSRNRAIFIYKNGTVIYSMRVALTLQCTMLLQYFPFDHQTCSIKIQSFGYCQDNVDVDWLSGNAVEIGQVEMPRFVLSAKVNLTDFSEQYITGSFATIKADLQIKRKIGYYILQVIIPSILLVILSWVSFLIDPHAVPARVSLSVTCILTMTTQSSGIRQTLPPVSYVKAIDVWMLVCLLFVFAALLEFAYVNVLIRKGQKNNNKEDVKTEEETDKKETSFEGTIDEVESNHSPTLKNESVIDYEDIATRVDKLSRILFPVTFAVFIIVFLCVSIPTASL